MLTPAFLVTIGILIPFFVAIFYSFTDLTLRSQEYEMVGFRNFVDAFTRPDFWHSMGITIKYAFVATAVEMVLGMCIALLLSHESGLSRFLRVVMIVPLMIAPVFGAVIWVLIADPRAGILGIALGGIGLTGFHWNADPDWALLFLIFVDIWIYTPFVVILVLAGLRSLPRSPYEAALIDGGSAWFVCKNLTLPMLAPVLLIALVIRLVMSLQEFAIIFVATKGGPAERTMSVAVAAYNEAFIHYNLSGAIPMLLLLWLMTYATCFVLIGFWKKAQSAASGAV